MIIDAHTHIHPYANGFGERFNASVKNLITSIKKNKVDKAVVLPIYPKVSNLFIAKACKEYPDKLIGFASINPHAGIKAVQVLEKEIKKYNLKGLKIHPRIQRIDPNDKKVIMLVKKATALNLPVLIDCFPQDTKEFPVEKTFPERIGKLARKVPEAKIIIAHAGGYKLWDAFSIARGNENIYIDFSLSPSFFKDSSLEQNLCFILKKLGAKRCLFGSDFPEISTEQALKEAKQMVRKAQFSSKECDYFFGKTLLSILPK